MRAPSRTPWKPPCVSCRTFEVHRDGDSIVARTNLGRDERVVLAGHLDTVPLPTVEGSLGTVPSVRRRESERDVIYGRGTTDMKGGVAVQLALANALTDPNRDITFVFYDHEEVASDASGLGRLMRNSPELLEADFAVLLEPTNGTVEGGCNGTMRFRITTAGKAAHSGRAWIGENAIHKQADVLARLAAYEPRTITVEGLDYREASTRSGSAGSGRQRDPGQRVGRHQLPFCPGQDSAAGAGPRARSLHGL